MPMKASPREFRDQAMRLYEAGWSYKAIALELSLNPYTVRDWVRSDSSDIKGDFSRKSPEVKVECLRMRAQGFSLAEISVKHKVPKRTLLGWIKREKESSRQPEPPLGGLFEGLEDVDN